ncbi:MAG TPA: glycosyltransferase family 2 protein [Candidatus Nitrosotalea sp.]|nr:glycosyltransferase family 2 protein [Candidatus Nitrosotalea sp.]
MPCLNEAVTVGDCVDEALAGLGRLGIEGEVVVADNGSGDGSARIAQAHGARVIQVAERGYGRALRAGIEAAGAEFVVMADADRSYELDRLEAFWERLQEGDELVLGNRFRGQILPGAMPWINRHLGNPLLSYLGRLFYRTPARDLHCGLRALSKSAFERMALSTSGMEFASEMVVRASLLGLRVSEVPVNLRPAGRQRPPHLRPWRDGWRHLRFLLLFSPRWLFLYPGLVLMLLGFGLGLWLLPGPERLGRVRFDVHSLLVASTLVILGYQAVTFALLVKLFALREGWHRPSPRLQRWLGRIRLERGLALGGLLTAVGLAVLLGSFLVWQARGFGNLNPDQTMRLVIPASTLLTLGMETIFASFFVSLLALESAA